MHEVLLLLVHPKLSLLTYFLTNQVHTNGPAQKLVAETKVSLMELQMNRNHETRYANERNQNVRLVT